MKSGFLFGLFVLLFNLTEMQAARVDTVQIFSVAMRKTVPALVILPAGYSPGTSAWPVVYLLHGWSGNFTGWLADAPQLPRLADRYGCILVCPDGGYDSWYLDSPVDSSVRYATHIGREVVDFIDHYYNTRRDRQGRAITGLSMGGHGAFWIAGCFPDRFGAIGSMAGGLDLRPFATNNWDLQGVLGNPKTQWTNWENASVVNRIDKLKAYPFSIILDCGVGDFFLETNREMHKRLLAARLPHHYTERPGEHNAAYWGSAVEDVLAFFDRFFRE